MVDTLKQMNFMSSCIKNTLERLMQENQLINIIKIMKELQKSEHITFTDIKEMLFK